jgi:uncharacterized protein YjbI with pentapeptide repeats
MDDDPQLSELDVGGERLRAEYLGGVRDFSERSISDVRLVEVELAQCDFTGTQFTNCVFGGVTFDNGVFDRARFKRCNVTGSRFQGASLKEVDLNPSVFHRADFFMASLKGANFLNCDASGAFFGRADLREASLYGGNFAEACFVLTDLTGSTLVGAGFENAIVKGFNFINTETIAKNARLLEQSLGQRKQFKAILERKFHGLEDMAMSFARQHLAEGEVPASMDEARRFIERLDSGFESLRRFLLASGCDPEEVARMGQAADKKQEDYPRVFISYSSEDEEVAARLFSTLTAFEVDTWFAPESMRGGRKIHEQLREAIGERDKIIFLLSEASMKSSWVASELQWAAGRELDSGEQILFPIRIVPFEAVRKWTLFDADVGQDIAKYVRQYFVPDFSAWQDEEALARLIERLLRDLRISQQSQPPP